MIYHFRGKVIHGKNRGKSFGFPTVNVPMRKIIPEGVYVSMTKFEGKWFESVTFVGKAETFGETEVAGETYIFDFNRVIYGEWISVRLLKKIRDSKKFTTKSELIENMNRDKKEALDYFKSVLNKK